MITVGKVLEVRTNDKAQEYVLELPIFKNAGVTNNRLNDATFVATCCCDSGTYSPYTIDDIVYVGFVNNRKSQPVILGKVLRNDRVKPASYMYLDALKVDNNVSLPVNTSIQTTTGEEMSLMYLKQRLDEIDDLRNIIDNLTKETESVKIYQHNLYIKTSFATLYLSFINDDSKVITTNDYSSVIESLSDNGFVDNKHTLQATGVWKEYNSSNDLDSSRIIIGVFVDNGVLNVVCSTSTEISNNGIYYTSISSGITLPSSTLVEIQDTVVVIRR